MASRHLTLVIKLEQTEHAGGCFGPCARKDYTVRIDATEAVRFEGRGEYVEIGVRDARMEPALALNLVNELLNSLFFEARDEMKVESDQ